ncbi:MAG: PAS domain-containing protein [Syntrophales bacterium]|nr:PAS domain-containing protein [Syntrophales bacterium]
MILVRKRDLLVLTILFCFIVIFGEIKFFTALKSIEVHTNLVLKYELENFIFASVVILLIVLLFFINFVRMSDNVLKRLDKMVELSQYGKYDITQHLDEMGQIGKRVKYLLFHLNNLNEMKTVKISSLSRVSDFLVDRADEEMFILDCRGTIINCSEKLAKEVEVNKKDINGKNIKDFFKQVDFENIYRELESKRSKIDKDDITLDIKGKDNERKITFIPIMNSMEHIAYIVGIMGGDKPF